MADWVRPSAEDDAKLARMLQEQEQEQQLASDSLVAALLQEEMNKASQKHHGSERSLQNARGSVNRPRSSFDNGSSSAREYRRSFVMSDAAVAQSIYDNDQKSFGTSDMAIVQILQDEKSHEMSDEALARVLQAEEEEKMAEQQRQKNKRTDSGPSRHANDNAMRRANSVRYSNRFRGDNDDIDEGFREELSGRRSLTRRSFPSRGLLPFSTPRGGDHGASSHHHEVTPDLERLQNSDNYEDLWQLAERLGDARSAGLPHHTIDSLPVTQYQQPAANLTPRPATAAGAQSAGDSAGKSEENSKCSICLEQFEHGQPLRTLPCLHRFHTHCIDAWLQEKGVCPVCRIEVKSALTTRS